MQFERRGPPHPKEREFAVSYRRNPSVHYQDLSGNK